MAESIGPILHVIVVGFHHKKGCQVEFSFPPLVPGAPNECPLGWKYLPTLALPDGSHNYDEDAVYFHLPSLSDPTCTIYGVSCFRQIPVEKLKNRTSDITRGTVQKSVCVLSTLPLYGHIQVKMALITHAYFDEGDFSKVSLLEKTYHHLNSCMTGDSQIPPQVFVGLSARDFILQFRHKALLLFKLLLLERRVIFYQSPVQPLCVAILTLLSLHPGMIERGLRQAAYVRPSRPMSPIPNFDERESPIGNVDSNLSGGKNDENVDASDARDGSEAYKIALHMEDNKTIETMEGKCMDGVALPLETDFKDECDNKDAKVIEVESARECTESLENVDNPEYSPKLNDNVRRVHSVNTITLGAGDVDGNLPRDTSSDALSDARFTNNIAQIARVNPEVCGLPLNLFSKGYLCLPYLSLPYLDLLGDENVRGYIVGATNVLFKQKKQLIDVLIEVESARIEATDPELRRQLHLTTEDLRFADYVVRHVAEPRKDVFLDGVGWEGGDEWIRTQFRVYLLSLLRTSVQQDTRQSDHFNSAFMAAWRTTNNYKSWNLTNNKEIGIIEPGHPFAGQLSVQDMKLRLTHTMQNTESGRKLNQAMASTGRAVATTGKAVGKTDRALLRACWTELGGRAVRYIDLTFVRIHVSKGGALSQAKGALSNWWSTLTTVQPADIEARCDNQTVDDQRTILNAVDKAEIVTESLASSTSSADAAVVVD